MFIKRVFALLLIITLLLPVLIAGGNYHASYYQIRETLLNLTINSGRLHKGENLIKPISPPCAGQRLKGYIISFYDYVPLEEIYDAVSIRLHPPCIQQRRKLFRRQHRKFVFTIRNYRIRHTRQGCLYLYEENEPVDSDGLLLRP